MLNNVMEKHSTETETKAVAEATPVEGIRPFQAIARLGNRLLDMAADFVATQESEISDSNRYSAHSPANKRD